MAKEEAREEVRSKFHEQELKERNLLARAVKLELQNAERRKELVETAAMRVVFGRIYSAYTSIVLPLGAKLADQVSAEYKLEDPVAKLRVQEILDDELYSALTSIKRNIDDFLTQCEAEALSQNAAPAPKKKPRTKRETKK
jgi:hypothetical protein